MDEDRTNHSVTRPPGQKAPPCTLVIFGAAAIERQIAMTVGRSKAACLSHGPRASSSLRRPVARSDPTRQK
jgi:hypothetical protein